MFVILAQATAARGHPRYPEGEIHSALVFVDARKPDEARRVAASEMEGAGWADVRLRRMGPLDPERLAGRDAAFRDSYEAAARDGAALVVYQEPDTAYAP